jgi:putative ABC transport system substrate-binding protein
VKRRDFIALTGGATAWPLVARAPQPDRTRRIGVLMDLAADDPEAPRRVSAFVQALRETGLVEGMPASMQRSWSRSHRT